LSRLKERLVSDVSALIDDLVIANRILGFEGVVDAYGHVSVRHPDNPQRFFLSRARTPQCIEADDIMEFTLDGAAFDPRGRTPYLERFIHAALYEARPDIRSVVHSHSKAVIPFGVGGESIRPIMHNCAPIGEAVPTWDSRTKFGDTDLLVSNMEMGRDLAHFMDHAPTALMRGHGSIATGRSLRRAVYNAISLQTSADLQMQSSRFDQIIFLSPGEIRRVMKMFDEADDKPLVGIDRAWEYWCHRAGLPFRPQV
jgi:ribulose-5-phosphate 4-epimerase/fuculose-1-phosphate aldolase